MLMVTTTIIIMRVSFWMILLLGSTTTTYYASAFYPQTTTSTSHPYVVRRISNDSSSRSATRTTALKIFTRFNPSSKQQPDSTPPDGGSEESATYQFSGGEMEQSKRQQRKRERERKAAARTTSLISSPVDDETKFGFGARIESFKCVVVGALAGGLALAPASLIHDIALGGKSVAQWEFDTDAGALEAALFTLCYRYCIRHDKNPQLNDGIKGAFVLTRSLSRMEDLPSYCSSVPVNCGPPLGYFDWYLLWELAVNTTESLLLFTAAASALEYCFDKKYISKFPG
jgi:hypothetical protein